jgi:hypothetical protein
MGAPAGLSDPERGRNRSRAQLSDQWLASAIERRPCAAGDRGPVDARAARDRRGEAPQGRSEHRQIADMVGMSEPMVAAIAGSRAAGRTRWRPSITSTERRANSKHADEGQACNGTAEDRSYGIAGQCGAI